MCFNCLCAPYVHGSPSWHSSNSGLLLSCLRPCPIIIEFMLVSSPLSHQIRACILPPFKSLSCLCPWNVSLFVSCSERSYHSHCYDRLTLPYVLARFVSLCGMSHSFCLAPIVCPFFLPFPPCFSLPSSAAFFSLFVVLTPSPFFPSLPFVPWQEPR